MCEDRVSFEVVGEGAEDNFVKHTAIVDTSVIIDLVESGDLLTKF